MEENKRINTSIAHLVKKRKLKDELSEMPSSKKVQSDTIGEESTSSNSFNFDTESTMFTDDDEAKIELQSPETSYSDFPTSSSSPSSIATTSESSLYSSDTRSLTNTSSSDPESMSINQLDFSFSENEKGDLLILNGVAQSSNNYILSSGRCTINQESQRESKKLTIDKEFEQYFSNLML